MLDSIRLYLRYLGVSCRAQMQYRASFLLGTAGQFLAIAIEFAGILVLFDRFGMVRGWTLPEIALFYGLVHIALAIGDAFGRGFDLFATMVKSGEFDRMLVRPRGTILQVAGQELTLRRGGRLLQALIVLLWGSSQLGLVWTPARVAVCLGAVIGGGCMFTGIFVLQGTLTFWTTESLEIVNTVTYGGAETGQFPLSIYKPWLRLFFTFVVPLACVNYFPAHALLGRTAELGPGGGLAWLSPFVGVAFLLVACRVWQFGVRHYRSTGS
jgi:ABC-2 type transport system permease protein